MAEDIETTGQISDADVEKREKALKRLRKLEKGIDPVLDSFLQLMFGANSDAAEGSFSLTISTDGTVVSGLAVSKSVWLEALVEQLRSGGLTAADRFGEVMDQWDETQKAINAERDRLDLWNAPHEFVHFKGASVAQGQSVDVYPLWRAEARSIDGWALGGKS